MAVKFLSVKKSPGIRAEKDGSSGVQLKDTSTKFDPEKSFQEGLAMGKKSVPTGSFGRLQEGVTDQEKYLLGENQKIYDAAGKRDPVVQKQLDDLGSLLEKRRKQADEGYSAEEMNAMRSGFLSEGMSALGGAMRGLKSSQAQSGIKGATAGAQQNRVASEFAKQVGENERQLYLKQQEAKRQAQDVYGGAIGEYLGKVNAQNIQESEQKKSALKSLQDTITGQQARQTALQQYNLDAASKERLAQLSTGLYRMGLDQTQVNFILSQQLAREQLAMNKDLGNQYIQQLNAPQVSQIEQQNQINQLMQMIKSSPSPGLGQGVATTQFRQQDGMYSGMM